MGAAIRVATAVASAVLLFCLTGCGAISDALVRSASGQEDTKPSVPTEAGNGTTPTPIRSEPSKKDLARTHENEASFVGTVTGYEAPEGEYNFCVDDETCVAVDGTGVSLSLIETWKISCHDAGNLDEELAIAAKEAALPVGTQVQVVRDRDPLDPAYEMTGFIHPLDNLGEPAAVSANEALVATGYWVPSSWSNSQQVGNYRPSTNWGTGEDTSSGDTLYVQARNNLTAVQSQYSQKLLDAANAARALRVGGQDICIRQIEEMAAEDAAGAARYNESSRRLELEYEQWKRDHPGWGHCIDGDGDGVCYED